MAYQPHTYVTFGGTLQEKSGQDEIWECGVRGFGVDQSPVDPAELDDLALLILRGPTGAGGGLEGLFADSRGKLASDAHLKWCKASNIGPDGKLTATPGVAQGIDIAGPSTPQAPSFCSVVISWGTGVTFGKALRGRMYLPNYGCDRGVGSTINATDQGSIADWAVDLEAVLDTSGFESPSFVPWVVSSAGAAHPFSDLRVGSIWDTQRRRKYAVPETYVSRDLSP